MHLKPISLTVFSFILLIFIHSCKQKGNESLSSVTPEYDPDVVAFTSGLISNQSVVRVKLNTGYSGEIDPVKPVSRKNYKIKPDVEGEVYWTDKQTLEFRPEEKFPSGEDFTMELRLAKILNNKNSRDFSFTFSTIPLNLEIDFTGIKSYSNTHLKWNRIEGKVRISDMIDFDDLEKILKASQGAQDLEVEWHHESTTGHSFVIDSVERKKSRDEVKISWDGEPVGINISGTREYSVPALGEFVFMEYRIIQHPEQYISLLFSDPLKADQDLEGLITLENNTSLSFSVRDNEISVFPNIRQRGTMDMNISSGIRNILNYTYQGSHSLSLNFEDVSPAVRLIGDGVIIPGSEGLLFPFEAVNLKAVDVKVIKIFENNIAQFLQVNRLSGENQLKRAGRLILKKTVDLIPERPINFGEWNAFSLDLTDLIEPEPGALYRIELSFRRKHSLYPCEDQDHSDQFTEVEDDFEKITEEEIAYWDASYGHHDYDYNYSGYRYYEREDPCTDSYFNYPGRKVARNILASNIGIIAKKGKDKSVLFAVSDIATTEPMQGVKIEVFNFQHKLLASLTTNPNGIASVDLENEPYLAIATKNQQRGYLRIDKGSSLSLSQFDISGSETEKGIKAYIYGERGVWRPGDSIFTTLILEDEKNRLPEHHPVLFELYDPRGKLRESRTSVEELNGFYSFHTATNPDDPTGMWNLKVRVGGLSFHKSLRVETVKPNRLKIDLDFGKDMIYSDVENLRGRLQADWLHGAPAGDLRARVEVNFTTRSTEFPGYSEYNFVDLSRPFSSRERIIFDAKLNASGEAVIRPDFHLNKKAPGMLTAAFTTRAFEKSGNFSTITSSMPYSPYPVYIGIKKPEGNRYGMLVTDSLYTFDIVTLNETGEPVPQKNLEVNIFKLQWRWWWHSADDNLASYTGNPAHKPVYTTTLNTSENGKGNFGFKIEYPEWGRYLVRVSNPSGGHTSAQTVYFDWPGWAGRASRKDPNAASILAFSSDKSKYEVGENAKITIPTSKDGRVFLSIENGTRVIDHFWLKPGGEETSFSFTVTPEMAPNVFIHATLLQPHSSTINDLPIRMYGVIPISVEDPATHMNPVIKMSDVLKPETETRIEVSEKNGKEMVYTLAMVDEGLLDLTGFQTPAPWSHFYRKEALGVSTFDLYNHVIGAYGGRIDGIFSIGGAMESQRSAEPKKRANRFPPMVKFEGPFLLKEGEKNIHNIPVPNYIGSVRTMVIAGNNQAYGNTEKTTPVRKALMVLSSLPRVLGPGEKVSLPVTVFAMEDQVKKVRVAVETHDLFEVQNPVKDISFETTGDKNVYFDLKVKERTGIGKVKVRVSSGDITAHHEVELEIRSPNPEVTEFSYTAIEPGENWEKQIDLPGIKGTNSSVLEVFSIPPFDFGRRLKALLAYPHGCIEQTTSIAFPQLYLKDIMEANEKMLEMTENNVKAAINRIGSFMLPSGGFSYWPGATEEDDWGTSYAGHFLLKAREKGYDVPQSWMNKWIKYQRKAARKWTGKEYQSEWHRRSLLMSQTYRLYTLALADESEMGAMNRLREGQDPGMANWHLIAAYAQAGKKEIAREMMKELSTQTPEYNTTRFYTYGSSLRDKSIILETMTLLGEKERAVPVMKYISEQLSSNQWYSTQSTGYALMSISEYLGENKTSQKLSFDYYWDTPKKEHAETSHPAASISKDMGEKEVSDLKITNTGDGTLYVRLSSTGTPLAGEEKAYSSNLQMYIEYQDMDGNALDISKLEQGTDFIAIVHLTNPGILGYYSDMALSWIFPSGWEIQNLRMFGSKLGDFDRPSYQDIRDDRVYSYFNLPQHQHVRFGFKLTATYAGRFYLPGVSCEAMYRNDIHALVPGKWIEVTVPGD